MTDVHALPARRPRAYPEQQFQISLVDFLRRALVPPAQVFSVPNGGLLPGATEAERKKAGALRRAMGLHNGVPDLCVMWQGGFGYLELKAPKGQLSDDQKTFRNACAQCGARWAQVRSMELAEGVLRDWGVPLRGRLS